MDRSLVAGAAHLLGLLGAHLHPLLLLPSVHAERRGETSSPEAGTSWSQGCAQGGNACPQRRGVGGRKGVQQPFPIETSFKRWKIIKMYHFGVFKAKPRWFCYKNTFVLFLNCLLIDSLKVKSNPKYFAFMTKGLPRLELSCVQL